MGIKSIVLVASVLFLSNNVDAALIDNGTYTTDDVNGIEWLDLDFTSGLSYSAAQSTVASIEGGGWTYATAAQVNNMFYQIFPTWVQTFASGYTNDTQYTAEVDAFSSLFGNSYTASSATTSTYTRAWYLDDAGILRLHGVYNNTAPTTPDIVYGAFATDYTGSYLTSGHATMGTYMVRASVVPVPAAVWLFGSGLIGLVGVARRKKS